MKWVIIIFSVFLFPFISVAQDKEEKSVREVMNAQVNAWNSGNIEAFMETYWKSDSLLFVGSKGPTYGWRSALEGYKKRYPDTAAMGKLDFTLIDLKALSENYYFVLGQWHLKRTIGDIGGYFTLLFKKINKKWVIIADHTS